MNPNNVTNATEISKLMKEANKDVDLQQYLLNELKHVTVAHMELPVTAERLEQLSKEDLIDLILALREQLRLEMED